MIQIAQRGESSGGSRHRQEFTKIILDRGHGYAILPVVGNTEVVNKQLNQRKTFKGVVTYEFLFSRIF